MELDIGDIHVTVDAGSEDEERRREISRAVERHLLDALEELSRSSQPVPCGSDEYPQLDLGEIDWEGEPDKTGKIVHLLKQALEEAP